jgi:thermitase
MPIRVLDSDGRGELWKISRAIIWAAQNGADIVNISFGYSERMQLLSQVLDSCGDGIVAGKNFPEIGTGRLTVIAAAGNGGNSLPFYPAAETRTRSGGNPRIRPLEGVINVAATGRDNQLTTFSNYNSEWIEMMAPGDGIVSAIPGGRYAVWSGTSMSAPIVAGVAALVKAKNPLFTPDEVVEQVEETGVPINYSDARRGVIASSLVNASCAISNNQNCPVVASPAALPFFYIKP